MNAFPENHIRPLVDQNSRGKLVESFSGFSDQQLRIALAQLIDGLERMDELSDGVQFVCENWRKAKPDNEGWKREVARKLRTTPSVAEPEENHWMRYQWQDANGKDCLVGNMNRQEVEDGIRQAWEFTRRFARMFNAGARDARNILAGDYLQAEADKPSPEDDKLSPSRLKMR